MWSALYLDDERRQEWLDLRGLDSWSDADYYERGTEQAADIIAFGLLSTWHTPISIAPNDRDSHIDSFTWLFGVEPLHMSTTSVRVQTTPNSSHTETGTPSTVRVSFSPDTAGTVEAVVDDTTPVAGYRFPMACGFPRWNSRNGGYGYVDPRDWTHEGVDLYAYEGTPVVAPVNGLVVASGYGDSAGWNVRIKDVTGRVHVLMYLESRPTVGEGERVRSGQRIAAVGRTGNASGGGPHIHYEIRDGEDSIDPMPWLRATGSTFVAPAASDLHTGTAPAFSSCETRA
ncbi:MAG: M23 family metallopeptidase [Acidimicrobiia bacterium]